MRKSALIFFALSIFTSLMVYDGSYKFSYSNVGGAPSGRTGSPGDGNSTCAVTCHTGTTVTSTAGLITSNIPPSGYLPGQTYTITASITGTGSRYGFEICSEKSGGTKVGTLVVTNATETQRVGTGLKWITHKTAGTSGSGGKTWSFNWIAPALGTGTVTFYGAFNKANNNNSSSGDAIVKSTLVVAQDPSAGFAEYDVANEINIFPNPVSDIMTIETELTNAELVIYDVSGKEVLKSQIEDQRSEINVSSLEKGIYFIKISSEEKIFSKKFVKL